MNIAKLLAGKSLANNWQVIKRIDKDKLESGANFSELYIVKKENDNAFMKALDFSEALSSHDVISTLKMLTEEFEFEKRLLDTCIDKKIKNVVTLIDAGTYREDGIIVPVPYFIFELADGDIRSKMDFSKSVEVAWIFRILHNVANGLFHLHQFGITHQDVKPSNVLYFDKKRHKITDLGRGDIKGHKSPFSEFNVAGDWGYAPIEQKYSYILTDWDLRRQACDAYLLGSLICFFFTQTNMSTLIEHFLAKDHSPKFWRNSYQEVLPYVKKAFQRAVQKVIDSIEDEELKKDVEPLIVQLCNPEPERRGHPRNLSQRFGKLSLERYVNTFLRLSYKHGMRGLHLN